MKQITIIPKFLEGCCSSLALEQKPGPGTLYLCRARDPGASPAARCTMPAPSLLAREGPDAHGLSPRQRGCDTMVSSISCQEKQQNVVAEVSAEPFPDLPITPISSKYFCFPLELQGEPCCTSPCVWGGGQAMLAHGVPRGELVAHRCGAHVLTAAVLEPPAVAALQRR